MERILGMKLALEVATCGYTLLCLVISQWVSQGFIYVQCSLAIQPQRGCHYPCIPGNNQLTCQPKSQLTDKMSLCFAQSRAACMGSSSERKRSKCLTPGRFPQGSQATAGQNELINQGQITETGTVLIYPMSNRIFASLYLCCLFE